MGHAHVHPPHELTEGPERAEAAPPARIDRRLELGAVLLLAVTTVATAWSGYQAAGWSGEQSQNYARAAGLRAKAQQQTTAAGQLRIDDILNFNGWLQARNAGNRELAAIFEGRFRPDFVAAFRAWLAQRPFAGTPAIPGPTYMPQYRLPQAARAAALEAESSARFAAGTKAKTNDDRYILSTVFFAAVLFFAGISLRLEWRPLRAAVLGMAAAMLLVGAGFVLTLPIA